MCSCDAVPHHGRCPCCRGEAQPSTVTFQLSELSSLPDNSFSPIATYQTLVQVRWLGGPSGCVV